MTPPAHPFLQQPEGKALEFKRDLSSPRHVLKTLVAFANSAGGRLVVGLDDDRIDIESPGLLLPGMTIEDMKSGISRIRNPVIARVFRELGLAEQWGSGIKRIFEAAAKHSLPEPLIEEIATRVRPRIWLAQRHVAGQPPASADDTSTLQRLESKLAAKLLMHLSRQPMGKADLARALGHATVSGELHKQVRRLLDSGHIEMTIPEKSQSRLQKHQLTERGRQALTQARTG